MFIAMGMNKETTSLHFIAIFREQADASAFAQENEVRPVLGDAVIGRVIEVTAETVREIEFDSYT